MVERKENKVLFVYSIRLNALCVHLKRKVLQKNLRKISFKTLYYLRCSRQNAFDIYYHKSFTNEHQIYFKQCSICLEVDMTYEIVSIGTNSYFP